MPASADEARAATLAKIKAAEKQAADEVHRRMAAKQKFEVPVALELAVGLGTGHYGRVVTLGSQL